jgi:hypothetical protein
MQCNVQELKVEHQQRMEGRAVEATPVIHHHQPRIIRGGSHAIHDKDTSENKPKLLRGGGGKHHDADDEGSTFSRQASTVTSGLISRLLGSGANAGAK